MNTVKARLAYIRSTFMTTHPPPESCNLKGRLEHIRSIAQRQRQSLSFLFSQGSIPNGAGNELIEELDKLIALVS